MDISELTEKNFDFFNAAAEDYMSVYYQINRLSPSAQHQRINSNEIFRDHIVICDVMQNNRYIEI